MTDLEFRRRALEFAESADKIIAELRGTIKAQDERNLAATTRLGLRGPVFTIKPLVWERDGERRYHFAVGMPEYEVWINYESKWHWRHMAEVYTYDMPCASLEAGKAAAEAHWRGLLSAVLEPVPAGERDWGKGEGEARARGDTPDHLADEIEKLREDKRKLLAINKEAACQLEDLRIAPLGLANNNIEQAKNEARKWPTPGSEDASTEHDRSRE